MTTSWRLIDDLGSGARAAEHMARDLAVLDSVASGGLPALRLYTWSRPALSLGHFQDEGEVDQEACRRLGVEVVRRPTGGGALLHGSDLTYAVALARPARAAGAVDALHDLFAGALVDGLRRLGVEAAVVRHDGRSGPRGPVCFGSARGADLRVGARKLCGSAQLRRRTAVLQHGSILLDRLPFDERSLLPGCGPLDLPAVTVTLRELGVRSDAPVVAAAVAEGFRATLDVDLTVEARV